MANTNLKNQSEHFGQLVTQTIIANSKMLFEELTYELNAEYILIRGKLSSYYALQRLLNNLQQIFSSSEGGAVYPVHIWVCVGPERSVFETLFMNRDDNKS